VQSDATRRDLGFARQSFRDFGELLKRYPGSRYAADARQRMIFLRNAMAQGELNVARFYFDRRAYVAAQNRAKYIIENYQQTPQAGDALAILTESYKQLGEEQLSKDSQRVLELNYPEHPYLAGGWPNRRNKLWQLLPFVGDRKGT
jgi:outer membrane protein assembly factor BamD